MKLFLNTTLLLSLTLAGCMKKVPYEANAAEAPVSAQRTDPSENTEKSTFVVTEGPNDDPRNQPAVTQISILKCQAPLLHLTSLVPGKHYAVTFHCYDGEGREVVKSAKPYEFVPTETVW